MILKIAVGLLVILVLLLAWVVFVPIRLYIDTDTHRYEISQAGTFVTWLRFDKGLHVSLKIFGVPLRFTNRAKVNDKREKTKHSKMKTTKTKAAWYSLIRNIACSFTLKKFILNIDTGDVVLNAKLVPVLLIAQNETLYLSTNFTGRLYAHIELNAQLNKVLWAFLKFLTSKNKNYGNEF
jgi:hypothetical protein